MLMAMQIKVIQFEHVDELITEHTKKSQGAHQGINKSEVMLAPPKEDCNLKFKTLFENNLKVTC